MSSWELESTRPTFGVEVCNTLTLCNFVFVEWSLNTQKSDGFLNR